MSGSSKVLVLAVALILSVRYILFMAPSSTSFKVGIQGVRASFHDVAARDFFGNRSIETVEFSSFQDLSQSLAEGTTDFAMMAIENTIAGSILPNYALLERFRLRVIGELYQRIIMNFMALPGQKIEDLRFVQSHAMALLQCEDFLSKHPHLKVLEAADTAESAKFIRENNLIGYSAIASELAAENYGLEILQRSIETSKLNYTRFLAISRDAIVNTASDKASLKFEISHRPGSLLSILSSFMSHGINMTKLQSVPILGRPYEYSFHVDLEWDDYQEYQMALREIELKTINLVHFGEYKKSARPTF